MNETLSSESNFDIEMLILFVVNLLLQVFLEGSIYTEKCLETRVSVIPKSGA